MSLQSLIDRYLGVSESKRSNPRIRPKRPRALSSEADGLDLLRAKRLSQRFHGTPWAVVELDDSERVLPRYLVSLGDVPAVEYSPPDFSQLAGPPFVHQSGDRGEGRPRSRYQPILCADPRTGSPVLVKTRSPMRFNGRRGLIG